MRVITFTVLAALLLTLVPATVAAPPPVRVAVLDSGILPTHSEFRPGQVVAWRDWVNGRATPYDDHGHGTAVASRVAGRTLGAHPAADLIVGKVLNSANGLPSWTPLAEAIRWATDQGAAVISVSIWGTLPQVGNHLQIANAIDYATARGALVVWIAGNGGELTRVTTAAGRVSVPSPVTAGTLVGSSSPRALVVGASGPDGQVATFSQRDPELVAWGLDVPIAWSDGGIYLGSGTSFAAPWVAGAAASLIAEGAPRDPAWLKWVLLHAATDRLLVTYVDEGYGLLDATALAGAREVARGNAPVPGPDARDAFHLATAAQRAAFTLQTPVGALPP